MQATNNVVVPEDESPPVSPPNAVASDVEDWSDNEKVQELDPHDEVEKPQVEAASNHDIPNTFVVRCAKFMARNPWIHFMVALTVSLIFSIVGLTVGNFSVAVDNAGWQSRGTLISNRQTQVQLVLTNAEELSTGDPAYWDELESTVQPGWEGSDRANLDRRLMVPLVSNTIEWFRDLMSQSSELDRTAPFALSESMARALQDSSGFEGCDISTYSQTQLDRSKLWPMWKAKDSVSALDPSVIRDICIAEQNTQAVLEGNSLCEQCSSGRCYPPYSLVLFARITVGDTSLSLSCQELAYAWSNAVGDMEKVLQDCVSGVTTDFIEYGTLPDQCPQGFSPTLVDGTFGSSSNVVRYTSSIFQTLNAQKELYEISGQFDRAAFSDVVYGAYDTADEAFNEFYVDSSVGSDMILALGSAVITGVAILVHTRSLWITLIGLLQVVISFPLAFFVYVFIAQLQFFPFLNFIGVFVSFALGADDVFVAMDKWKNARIANRRGTVEDVAAIALPDAAAAMFLTSITTAVAFFSTAISPVAPLKCFAVFCGILILFDYLMCVLLVFPALCIYDRWLLRGNNFFCSCHVCKKRGEDVDDFPDEDLLGKPSFIHRSLSGFYIIFHKLRWIIVVLSVAAMVVSAIFASHLQQPTSSDVRLLSSSIMYEQAYEWSLQSLYTLLRKRVGNPGFVMWGVKAADTGNYANPKTWSQLVLDDDFDASSPESQIYLLDFCDKFFSEDFANYTNDGYVCAMNQFDSWLRSESISDSPSSAYTMNCDGATGIPMSSEFFNPCISTWTNENNIYEVLERNGTVKVIFIEFQQRVRFDSPYAVLNNEWQLIESWFKTERSAAPDGVNQMYHSSADFWWYDTNGNILQAAIGSAAISLGFSGLVVFLSSRSFILTLFCVFTIGFILTATTALLVASGWTLGFLESICFAILIGISCDFVLHFSHAYAYLPGEVGRNERTKYALIHMGPSILAAAFTTICSAIIMLFCVISFFKQFAQILFYTILMSTIGSFIVFLSLADTLGPSRPTYLFDKIWVWCSKWVAKCCQTKDRAHDRNNYDAGEIAPEEESNGVEDTGHDSNMSKTEKLERSTP